MKIPAIVIMLSLLANLSFARFSEAKPATWAVTENLDTANRDRILTNLHGNWTNLNEARAENGFSSLSLLASGKFEGTTADNKRVCGFWELSADSTTLKFHKTCEETGRITETVLAQIKLMDGTC